MNVPSRHLVQDVLLVSVQWVLTCFPMTDKQKHLQRLCKTSDAEKQVPPSWGLNRTWTRLKQAWRGFHLERLLFCKGYMRGGRRSAAASPSLREQDCKILEEAKLDLTSGTLWAAEGLQRILRWITSQWISTNHEYGQKLWKVKPHSFLISLQLLTWFWYAWYDFCEYEWFSWIWEDVCWGQTNSFHTFQFQSCYLHNGHAITDWRRHILFSTKVKFAIRAAPGRWKKNTSCWCYHWIWAFWF